MAVPSETGFSGPKRRTVPARRNTSVKPDFLEAVSGAALKNYEVPETAPPTLTASSEVAGLKNRLTSVGVTPAEPPKFDDSPFGQLLTHLSRPGAAVRGALTSGKDLWSGLSQGWNDPTSVPTGADIYEAMGKTNLPFAGVHRAVSSNAVGRFVGGSLYDLMLDPLTYVGVGPLAKGAKAAGLAKDAAHLKIGNIPISPNLRPAGDFLGAVSDKLPGVRGAKDAVGELFNPLHIPSSVTGTARTEVGAIQDVARAAARKEPVVVERALKGTTADFRHVVPQARTEASQILENIPHQAPVGASGKYTRLYLPDASFPTSGALPIAYDSPTAASQAAQRLAGMGPKQIHYVDVPTSQLGRMQAGAGAYAVPKNYQSYVAPISAQPLRRTTVAEDLLSIGAAHGTPEGKSAASIAAQSLDSTLQRMGSLGQYRDFLDSYAPHLYNDPPDVTRQALASWKAAGAHQTVLPYGAEAKALGLHPIEDVGQFSAIHSAIVEGARVHQQLGQDVLRLGPNVVSQTQRAADWAKLPSVLGLQGYFAHPQVVKTLSNLAPILNQTPEGIKLARSLYGTAMHYFKGIALGTLGFQARNFTGNIWLNAADGLINPLRYAQSAAVLSGKLPGVELAGRMWNREDLLRAFQDSGLTGQGIFREIRTPVGLKQAAEQGFHDLDTPLAKRAMENVVPSREHPLAPLDALLSATRKSGEGVDTFGRMTSFLHHLDMGESVEQAAASVRKALFDYGDLTAFEQKILRPVIPFYSWMRNNLPRQLELLLTNPKMAAGTEHIRSEAVNATNTDESSLPDYLRASGAIPVGSLNDGQNPIYATLNLPLYDLQFLHDPSDVQAFAKQASSQLSPFITAPVQIATNTNLFTGQPLTETPGLKSEAASDYVRFLASTFGGGAGRTFDTATRDAERQRQLEANAARGGGAEVAPIPRVPGQAFLPVSVQDVSANARTKIYEERDLLQQQGAEYTRDTGKPLPTVDEVKRQKDFAPKDFKVALDNLAAKPPTNVAAERPGGRPDFLAAVQPAPKVATGEAPQIITQSVALSGVPRDWEPYLKLLVQRESGGSAVARSPTPVLNTWSNPGHPFQEHATGIMQMLPSTFEANARRAAKKSPQAFASGFNIWDPMQNMLAAIEYIKGRYGHPARIPGLTGSHYPGY